MAPVVLVADLSVHTTGNAKRIKKDLKKIAGVVEVCVSLVTGYVAIVGIGDATTLWRLLEDSLKRPVFLLADFGAMPAPPPGGGYDVMPPWSPAPARRLGRGNGLMPPSPPSPRSAFPAPPYGYGVMPAPWPAPNSRFLAPPIEGYYDLHDDPYNQPGYGAPPPPDAGYYYTPFGGRPWSPHYMRNDVPGSRPPTPSNMHEYHSG